MSISTTTRHFEERVWKLVRQLAGGGRRAAFRLRAHIFVHRSADPPKPVQKPIPDLRAYVLEALDRARGTARLAGLIVAPFAAAMTWRD